MTTQTPVTAEVEAFLVVVLDAVLVAAEVMVADKVEVGGSGDVTKTTTETTISFLTKKHCLAFRELQCFIYFFNLKI